MWEENGNLIVSNPSGYAWFPELCEDGVGGAIIVWEHPVGMDMILYAQRVDSYGNRLWTGDGVPLNGLTGADQNFHRVIADGEGGVIAVRSHAQ